MGQRSHVLYKLGWILLALKRKSIGAAGCDLLQIDGCQWLVDVLTLINRDIWVYLGIFEWTSVFWDIEMNSSSFSSRLWLCWTPLIWSPWSKSRSSLKWVKLCRAVALIVLSCTCLCSNADRLINALSDQTAAVSKHGSLVVAQSTPK